MLVRLAEEENLAESGDFVRALAVLGRGDYPPSMEETPGPMWLRGNAALTDGESLAEATCVQPLSTLRHLVLDETVADLMAHGLSLAPETLDSPSPVMRDAIAFWRQQPVERRRLPFQRGSCLGPPGGLLWFTSRQQFEAAVAPEAGDARGQRARDSLGLDHRQMGETLIAVHFPQSAVADSSARPTFIDAATHKRFMAWPEDEAGQRDRAWGRTVDLEAFSTGTTVIDGCPERVAPEVDAEETVGRWTIRVRDARHGCTRGRQRGRR